MKRPGGRKGKQMRREVMLPFQHRGLYGKFVARGVLESQEGCVRALVGGGDVVHRVVAGGWARTITSI
jgi:hypothetical protein